MIDNTSYLQSKYHVTPPNRRHRHDVLQGKLKTLQLRVRTPPPRPAAQVMLSCLQQQIEARLRCQRFALWSQSRRAILAPLLVESGSKEISHMWYQFLATLPPKTQICHVPRWRHDSVFPLYASSSITGATEIIHRQLNYVGRPRMQCLIFFKS